MSLFRKILSGALGRFLGRLRFPWLFVFTVVVFLADLAIPDGLPLIDEILLAVGSLILGNLKERVTEGRPSQPDERPTRDGDPPHSS